MLTAYVHDHLSNDEWRWVPGVRCSDCAKLHTYNNGECHGCNWIRREGSYDPDNPRIPGWVIPPLFVKRTLVTRAEYGAQVDLSWGVEDECEACRSKPGSPNLCKTCLKRRRLGLHSDLPISNVSHDEANAYCESYSYRHMRVLQEGDNWFPLVRLPTVEEWRHFAGNIPTCTWPFVSQLPSDTKGVDHCDGHGRMVSDSEILCAGCQGTGLSFPWIDAHAWTNRNSEGRTQPVGKLAPTQWGLADVWGNLCEWTSTPQGFLRIAMGGHRGASPTMLGPWTLPALGEATHPNWDYIGFRPVRFALTSR